jgi:hypothetical protein
MEKPSCNMEEYLEKYSTFYLMRIIASIDKKLESEHNICLFLSKEKINKIISKRGTSP